MNILGPFMVAGMVVGAGVLLIIMGSLRSPIRLTDAFAALEGSVPETQETRSEHRGLEALGDWLHATHKLPLTHNQQRAASRGDQRSHDASRNAESSADIIASGWNRGVGSER